MMLLLALLLFLMIRFRKDISKALVLLGGIASDFSSEYNKVYLEDEHEN